MDNLYLYRVQYTSEQLYSLTYGVIATSVEMAIETISKSDKKFREITAVERLYKVDAIQELKEAPDEQG